MKWDPVPNFRGALTGYQLVYNLRGKPNEQMTINDIKVSCFIVILFNELAMQELISSAEDCLLKEKPLRTNINYTPPNVDL